MKLSQKRLAWILLASLNLAAGAVISSSPRRQSDFEAMQAWTRTWLVDGADVYDHEIFKPTYPPHAIVALSPLGAIDPRAAVPLWMATNVGLAVLAVFLTTRTMRPAGPLADVVIPMTMFLCWGGFRALLQFSLLSVTFGLAAMVFAVRRPLWSGTFLGLALMKPQIGAPFLLWSICARRFRVALTAAAVCIAGLLVYAVRAEVGPLQALGEYARILRLFYTDDSFGLVGLAQLRPLVALAFGAGTVTTVVAWLVVVATFCAVALAGWMEGRRSSLLFAAPAMASVWSLIAFYHLTYGFVVLLPVAALLLWADSPETAVIRRRTFWLMQLGLMVDVPSSVRWTGADLWLPRQVVAALGHADRVFALALLVTLTWIAIRHYQWLGRVERARRD